MSLKTEGVDISPEAVDVTLRDLTDAAVALVNLAHGGHADEVEQAAHVMRALRTALTAGGDEAARVTALKALWAEKDARYAAQKESGEEFVNLWGEYHKRGEALKKSIPYTHVVFGFDTAHYMDDQNYALHDPEYIMRLAREMRAEIAGRAKTYKAAA